MGINKEFQEFGKYIQVVAILTLVGMVAGITGFVALILLFVALGCLKRANNILNNSLLHEFRSRYIKGFISRIAGTVIMVTGVANLVIYFFIPTPFPLYITLSLSIVLMLAGIAFIYAGVASEMKAWKNLKIFFENSSKLFPADISSEVAEGCDKLKTGALLSSLGFLIIPAIIGFIYQVQGYFKLATLNKLSLEDAPKYIEVEEDLPEPQAASKLEAKVKFCPNCGAELSGLGRFCALCGSQIS
ncbi:MAG: hypothetical protein ACXABG_07665 [Promethearchaeota archaeon]|jgi:hypothetical protein